MKSTYEKVAEAIKDTNNKKDLFDCIYLCPEGESAETIAEFLRDCSTTFVSDIAKKHLEYKNPSEKQAWCMVFESMKISHMIDAWIEKELDSIK